MSLSGVNFNSHAHVERDETSSFYDGENKNFNSHAHVERDLDTLEKSAKTEFQLTRSRGA